MCDACARAVLWVRLEPAGGGSCQVVGAGRGACTRAHTATQPRANATHIRTPSASACVTCDCVGAEGRAQHKALMLPQLKLQALRASRDAQRQLALPVRIGAGAWRRRRLPWRRRGGAGCCVGARAADSVVCQACSRQAGAVQVCARGGCMCTRCGSRHTACRAPAYLQCMRTRRLRLALPDRPWHRGVAPRVVAWQGVCGHGGVRVCFVSRAGLALEQPLLAGWVGGIDWVVSALLDVLPLHQCCVIKSTLGARSSGS
jgi:hypothetical protein